MSVESNTMKSLCSEGGAGTNNLGYKCPYCPMTFSTMCDLRTHYMDTQDSSSCNGIKEEPRELVEEETEMFNREGFVNEGMIKVEVDDRSTKMEENIEVKVEKDINYDEYQNHDRGFVSEGRIKVEVEESSAVNEENMDVKVEENNFNDEHQNHETGSSSVSSHKFEIKDETESEESVTMAPDHRDVMELHKCLICKVNCWSKETLAIHMETHSSLLNSVSSHSTKQRYSIVGSSLGSKNVKVKYHSGKAPKRKRASKHHKCDQCDAECSDKTEFLRHMRNHPRCYICNSFNKDQNALDEHMKTHPQCTVCKIWFGSKAVWASHMINRHGKRSQRSRFECKICKEWFTRRANVTKHIQRKHRNQTSTSTQPKKLYLRKPLTGNEKKFRCDTFGDMFDDQLQVCVHQRLTHPKCALCNIFLFDAAAHQNHMQSMHSQAAFPNINQPKIHTPILPMPKRKTKASIAAEKVRNAAKINLPFRCADCAIDFPDQNALDNHCKLHRQCGKCGLWFKRYTAMEEHMRGHPRCAMCKERCMDQPALDQHMTSHPQCQLCGARTVDQVELEAHVRNKHPKCPVCNLQIINKSKQYFSRHKCKI